MLVFSDLDVGEGFLDFLYIVKLFPCKELHLFISFLTVDKNLHLSGKWFSSYVTIRSSRLEDRILEAETLNDSTWAHIE